jgi:hypothetical protein
MNRFCIFILKFQNSSTLPMQVKQPPAQMYTNYMSAARSPHYVH